LTCIREKEGVKIMVDFQEHMPATDAGAEFRRELEEGKFTLTCSPNEGLPYADEELQKNSKAVEDFMKSDLFKTIKSKRIFSGDYFAL
jgi:hypothetical protein